MKRQKKKVKIIKKRIKTIGELCGSAKGKLDLEGFLKEHRKER